MNPEDYGWSEIHFSGVKEMVEVEEVKPATKEEITFDDIEIY